MNFSFIAIQLLYFQIGNDLVLVGKTLWSLMKFPTHVDR